MKAFYSLGICGLLLVSCVSTAQNDNIDNDNIDDDTDVTTMKIDLADGIMEDESYYQSWEKDLTGFLDDGETITRNFSVFRDKEYAVVGVCDNNCSDIDVSIYTDDGKKIASDNDKDDVATVTFTAAYDGQYQVKIKMFQCAVASCRYRVRNYILTEMNN